VADAREALKQEVHDHWNQRSCGEGYAETDAGFDLSAQERERYALEPYLSDFARFEDGAGKDVLEVGVGMGADHLMWARSGPRSLSGVDLTERAVEFTTTRLKAAGFVPNIMRGDAENLPFPANHFDIVYSWGVMHHSPATERCFADACRVLRPGGTARIMVYHTWSMVGLMLWARYGLLAGQPTRTMAEIYHDHLESPGTKAYTVKQAHRMMKEAGFSDVSVRVQLSHGDLLEGQVGARHEGRLLRLAKSLWPRPLVRMIGKNLGLYLLIEARK
jgi:ubiquinone/menaquinone biosynthesis C-methylase UbiE